MSFSKEIKKIIEDAIDAGFNVTNMRRAAGNLRDSIKQRTRLGKGVETIGGNLKSLKKLTDPYKKQRRKFKKKGGLSGETTPAKSNLTRTGDMLDSLKVTNVSKRGFSIEVSGAENKKKAKYVQEERPFFNLASFEIKVLINELIDKIKKK